MSKVKVNPGVCGFKAIVRVTKQERGKVAVKIATACEYVKKMEADLQDIDGMNEIFGKLFDSAVYNTANKNVQHIACLVPSAILKAIEVECGLALPRDVDMEISK